MPASSGTVVVVVPGSILLIFSRVCVTVPTVPMFSVAPTYSCCVKSKSIVLSSNDSVILFNFMRSSSSARQGLVRLGVLWGGFSWGFFGV